MLESIHAVVLAAGAGTRMGGGKLLLPFKHRTLLEHAVSAALDAGLGRTIVVLGHLEPKARQVLERSWPGRKDLDIIYNPDYVSGMSTSLRVGLARAAGAEAVVFCLADQPLVTPATIRRLAQAYLGSEPRPLVVAPSHAGRRGNPVLIDRRLFGAVQDLTGDTGARRVVETHLDKTLLVECGPEVLFDVDTPEDFERLR